MPTVVLDCSQGVSRCHEDNALFKTSHNNVASNDERAEGHEMEVELVQIKITGLFFLLSVATDPS